MILERLANAIVGLTGWKVVGEDPKLAKAVFIAAPHTSNWDGFWWLLGKTVLRIEARFLVKHTAFWWPLGPLLERFGAIPIDRSDGAEIVPQLVGAFESSEHLYIALAPEGTRKRSPYWKTGFYRIATEAGVPIVLVFIDYATKRMGIGPTIEPSGDWRRDLDRIREFYAPFGPRRPENTGPIEFPPRGIAWTTEGDDGDDADPDVFGGGE